MSDDEERRVKARHDVTQFYQRRKIVSRRELPRGDMSIEGDQSLAREEESSEDDNVEDDTYIPSPVLILMERENGLLVLVAVGQQEMTFRRKMMVLMVRRRKKRLMLRRSAIRHMLTWDLLCLGCLQTLHGG
jgi:hypothetical protein